MPDFIGDLSKAGRVLIGQSEPQQPPAPQPQQFKGDVTRIKETLQKRAILAQAQPAIEQIRTQNLQRKALLQAARPVIEKERSRALQRKVGEAGWNIASGFAGFAGKIAKEVVRGHPNQKIPQLQKHMKQRVTQEQAVAYEAPPQMPVEQAIRQVTGSHHNIDHITRAQILAMHNQRVKHGVIASQFGLSKKQVNKVLGFPKRASGNGIFGENFYKHIMR